MIKLTLIIVSAILISVILLVGALYWYALSPGKRPFLMVQVCLRDEQNRGQFISMMKSIAQSEGMNLIDGSASTQRDLTALKANPNYQIINIGVLRGDGMGLGAGNLGLSPYEVALGFSEGSSSSEAHRFADVVIGALKQKWHVELVPTGRGALPMKNCGK